MIDTLCIFGVGLIGGSLARGLRKQNWCRQIVGIDTSDQALTDAKQLGIVDVGFNEVNHCEITPDVVVVAVPVASVKRVFLDIAPWFQKCKLITDVGSTKISILNDLAEVTSGKLPSCFVAGHPIAGREQSGVQAAVDNLFENRKVILTPTSDTNSNSLLLATEMWQKVGAQVEHLDPGEHDQILAATSHLPHALAFALVHCLSTQSHTPEIFRYAAGGFADFTRIASSDPVVWRDICLANREELLRAIDEFDINIKQLRTCLENADGDSLQEMFQAAKDARDRFNGNL